MRETGHTLPTDRVMGKHRISGTGPWFCFSCSKTTPVTELQRICRFTEHFFDQKDGFSGTKSRAGMAPAGSPGPKGVAIHAGVQAVTPGQLATSGSLPGPEQLTRKKDAVLTGMLHQSQGPPEHLQEVWPGFRRLPAQWDTPHTAAVFGRAGAEHGEGEAGLSTPILS